MAYRKNGLRIDDLHSVKLDGLSEDVKAEELEEAFSKFGEVQDCYIPRDFRSGRGKGFGFVRFQHRDQAEDAAAAEIVIDGHKLETTLATRGKRDMSFRDREERDGRKGGGRGRDSRRRSRSRGRGGGRRNDSRGRGGRGRY
mmetsp:Transcript_10185/g.25020  ORF Transcript_10185/g.25020 Transcript_10185/m.25020 type:complete len:142 (+) Transcript_10185:324-749(+)